jgi:hypothetical protein
VAAYGGRHVVELTASINAIVRTHVVWARIKLLMIARVKNASHGKSSVDMAPSPGQWDGTGVKARSIQESSYEAHIYIQFLRLY